MLGRVASGRLPLLFFVLFAAGCGSDTPSTAPSPTSTPQDLAKAYLTKVLDTMEGNSVYRNRIDWPSFRQAVTALAPNPQTIPDTYPAIQKALDLLDDLHARFVKPDGSYIWNPDVLGRCTIYPAPTPSVPADIGYVRVDSYLGDSATQGTEFATGIQRTIGAADSRGVKGWIVDLRGNNGGNMWPMIAGVGPVLGEGRVGAFLDRDAIMQSYWSYENGVSTNVGPIVRVPEPYTLTKPSAPVAVLTDCTVASSGEAVVIAFRGRPNTRSFGSATFGASTAPRVFNMSDGGQLILACLFMADRELTRYGGSVVPDEVVEDPTQTAERAISWLRR